MPGQHLRGAAVEELEVRGGLPERVRRRERSARRHRAVAALLQPGEAAPGPGVPDADACLPDRNYRGGGVTPQAPTGAPQVVSLRPDPPLSDMTICNNA